MRLEEDQRPKIKDHHSQKDDDPIPRYFIVDCSSIVYVDYMGVKALSEVRRSKIRTQSIPEIDLYLQAERVKLNEIMIPCDFLARISDVKDSYYKVSCTLMARPFNTSAELKSCY